MGDQLANGNGNGRRVSYEWRISFGNILTIIGGLFMGAVFLVTLTRAYDDLDKKIDILGTRLDGLKAEVHLYERGRSSLAVDPSLAAQP